eukprot:jgi/Chlat1/5784/Chrsp387S09016
MAQDDVDDQLKEAINCNGDVHEVKSAAEAAAAECDVQPSWSALDSAMEAKVRPFLDLMDQLRQEGIQHDLAIPQIAVVGDQSSGKSSVLESLSGIPFPRGRGAVTRCPIEIQMKRGANWEPWRGTARIGSEEPCMHLESPEKMEGAIRKLSEQLLKSPGGYSETSIVVEVISPDVPDLTVIDLPGIVRTTTAGQSDQVMTQIDNMYKRYLQQERTIILAVVPADQDIATIEILERAKQVDPVGDRTIPVLTKPDKVFRSEEDSVISVMNNITKPQKLGYAMVKNRSAQQMKDNLSIHAARKDEELFFKTHPKFRQLDPTQLGIQNLATRLTTLLVSRIEAALPSMHEEILAQLTETEAQLRDMGVSPPDSHEERQKALIRVVQGYYAELDAEVEGRDGRPSEATLSLYTKAMTSWRHLQQRVAVDLKPKFDDQKMNDDIVAKIEAQHSREIPGFFKYKLFKEEVARIVKSWRFDTDLSSKQVLAAINQTVNQIVHQFPQLRATVKSIAEEVAAKRMVATRERLEELFDQEMQAFTMSHKYQTYLEELDRMRVASNKNPSASPNSTADMLKAYWQTAHDRFIDQAVGVMDQKLMRKLASEVQAEILLRCQDPELLRGLFTEDRSIQTNRNKLIAKRDRLVRAEQAMDHLQAVAATKA